MHILSPTRAQALLQSLPQAALITYILAARTASCHANVAVLCSTLALALINVLGKLAHFLALAMQQYGGHGHVPLINSLKRQAQDMLSLEGACRLDADAYCCRNIYMATRKYICIHQLFGKY